MRLTSNWSFQVLVKPKEMSYNYTFRSHRCLTWSQQHAYLITNTLGSISMPLPEAVLYNYAQRNIANPRRWCFAATVSLQDKTIYRLYLPTSVFVVVLNNSYHLQPLTVHRCRMTRLPRTIAITRNIDHGENLTVLKLTDETTSDAAGKAQHITSCAWARRIRLELN